MPENNFEQQAKNLVSNFNLKPQEAVWTNVQKAIEPPKRKRRFVLWWWLLPVCLFGVAGLFLVNKNADVITANNANERLEKASEKDAQKVAKLNADLRANDTATNSVNASKSDANKQAADNNFTKKENKQNRLYKSLDSSKNVQANIDEKVNLGSRLIKYKNAKTKTKNKSLKVDVNSFTQNDTRTLQTDFTKTATNDSTVENKYVSDYSNLLTQKNTDTTKVGLVVKLDAGITKKTNRPDSLFVIDTTAMLKDSSDILVAKNVIRDTAVNTKKTKLKSKHSPWHFGVLAEAGTTSRNASFLNLSTETSMNFSSGFPTGNTTVGSSYRSVYKIGSGPVFGAGIAAQKKLLKNLNFQASFQYRYQAYKSFTTLFKDSVSLSSFSTSAVGSFHAAEHFHFVSIYAGLQWYFFNKNTMQIGVTAGIDNSLLLAVKQKISNASGVTLPNDNSSLTALTFAAVVADAAISHSSFYSYQPQIAGGLVVNFILPKSRQLQLLPYVRNSILMFEKNNTSNNNHIFSAGLQAIYFFK